MNQDDRTPNIVETASATTSPDNSNSGPFAYIITAVVLGLLLIFSLAVGGCSSFLLGTVVQQYANGSASYMQQDFNYYDDLNNYDNDWQQWMEQYENDLYGNDGQSSDSHKDQGMADVEDVLDFDIAPYGSSVDEELSASAYAGVPTEVRDYVRSLVNADEDYSTRLVVLLNDAALNEETRSEKITEAIALCDEATAFFNESQIPAVQGDETGSVKDMLGTSKGDMAQRWSLMKDEVSMLDTNEQVDTKRLWEVDDKVVETTYEAAEHLEEAMSAAASL